MKRLTLFLLLALAGGILFAQAPDNYYNSANGKTGDELRSALHEIIKGHTTISYNNIWTAFWSTDNKGNNVVWDMYSDGANYTYSYQNGNDQCGEYTQEGDCYNREHSWPESWFGSQSTPRTDLHHIFPTDGFVNNQRSSNPFGEVNTVSWTSQNGSKLGTCKSSLGYNGTVFEPIDEYKGDFARALMYMSVRYYTEDSDWGTSGMTNKSEILPWAIQMLLSWNESDPVSQKEIDRNNVIYNDYQHNRNPFIDNPEYARMIWDPNWHGGLGNYEKVTSSDEITDGDYLIVCENNSVAFNGGLTSFDVVGNTIEVAISGNSIESNATTDAAAFTITAKTGGYSIKSASGYYIGNTSDANALKTSQNDVYVNSISITDGNADIVSSLSHLRYNAADGQTRFRYFKSSTYTGQQAIQLYKKAETYSITLATVEHGSISANAEVASEGSTITLTAMPEDGYELDYWMVTQSDGSFVTVTNNQFEMPASNVTVSATFVYVGVPFVQHYYLVTSTDQLVAGRTYLIVNTAAGKALGTTQNNNNRAAASVTISSNMISSIGTDVCELILGGQSGAWTFKDGDVGYLYAVGGGNYLRTQSALTDKGKWSISISNGVATIVSNGNVSQNTIKFNPNNNNPIFSCYASGQQDVCLFIRSEEYNITENTIIANLFSFDKHTVHSGATLTVSGTATCNDATQLIIEEDAQLVHHNEGVQATLKKTIQAYTDNGGWYTIATPFTTDFNPASVLTTGQYDLYAYDEDANLEWVNYKAGNFNLASGQGYLYAHNPTAALRMSGTLNSGEYTATVDLSYANSSADLKGFNLLGNPVAHDISFTKSSQVSDGYYYLNYNDAWTYVNSNSVPVGRGFLVKANADNQTVMLNPQSKGYRDEKGQYLCLSIGEEKAYVKLNEGVSMPLMDLNGRHSSLYLMQERKPYIMLVRDDANALDLCFEARQECMQTLTVDAQGLDLDYLHLIDNMTGADVDLLATSSYAFEASKDDYATRFRLAFAPTDDPATDSETFAYWADGEIGLIAEPQGMATLQVMDLTGRILVSRDGVHTVSTNGMTPGVYVLRLVTDDDVRVQKIVVK